MDRISDSGSDGCGSIPHGGTILPKVRSYSWLPVNPGSILKLTGNTLAHIGRR